MAEITDAEIIGKYIKIRDFIAKKTLEFEEGMKPYQKAMQALEGSITQVMIEQGHESIKTDQGTAYRTTVMAVRMADRDSFLDFVFNGNEREFVTNAITKEAVETYMEEHQSNPPPGVDVTYIHKTNFRKPT